jgi:hypothetical protein
MSDKAAAKLEQVHKRGTRVELGPEEIVDFSSAFLSSLMPTTDPASRRLIISPSAAILNRRFKFKLTFVLGERRQEFSYLESEVVRPGREEFVVRSSAPVMPLRLTLAFNLVGGISSFNAEFSYVGHEIRNIYKAHEAVSLLKTGGKLEIVDLESDRLLCVMGGVHDISAPTEADLYLDSLIPALYEVALGFNDTITWTADRTRDDSIHIQLLQQVVRNGTVSIPADTITISLCRNPGIDIDMELRSQRTFCIGETEAPEFATVFGKTFDVGPHVITIHVREFEIVSAGDQSSPLIIKIRPDEPLIYYFERFTKKSPSDQLVDA